MRTSKSRNMYIVLQVIAWLICISVYILYGSIKWRSVEYAMVVTLVNFSFYLLLIYGHSLWLIPKFYSNSTKTMYVLFATLYFLLICCARLFAEKLLLFPIQKVFYNVGLPHIALVFVTNLIAFLFSILLFVANDYVHLLKREEVLKAEHLSNQLHWLKQQVQPHFLFNTLNNIYALAHAKSDDTKTAIAKLADMMRYFTEDAPKEKIHLQKEISFIENYIALEQLRLLHPVQFEISFTKENVEIPTMLLMPFVENIFKHGVDKTLEANKAELKIEIVKDRLHFFASNKIVGANGQHGFGLANLIKRLDLIYGDNCTMNTQIKNDEFEAYLDIPLI